MSHEIDEVRPPWDQNLQLVGQSVSMSSVRMRRQAPLTKWVGRLYRQVTALTLTPAATPVGGRRSHADERAQRFVRPEDRC